MVGSFEEVSSKTVVSGPAGAPPARMSGWRASPSIAHREKRDSSVYVVGKVRLSPLVDFDPAPALGWVAAEAAGVRAGELLHCPTWAMAAAGPVRGTNSRGLAAYGDASAAAAPCEVGLSVLFCVLATAARAAAQ